MVPSTSIGSSFAMLVAFLRPGRKGQDIRTLLPDRDRVLKMRRKEPVGGNHRPTVLKELDRRLSAHFEHTVAIREEGPEILTLPSRS